MALWIVLHTIHAMALYIVLYIIHAMVLYIQSCGFQASGSSSTNYDIGRLSSSNIRSTFSLVVFRLQGLRQHTSAG
jgi:hypothetical protein